MNWMLFFLAICMYPILLVMYFNMKNEVKPKGKLRFGVTVPKAYFEDEQILEVARKYRFEIKRNMIILLFVPVLFWFVPYVSVSFTAWMLWLLAMFVCMVVPFIRANRQVARLKEDNHWQFSSGETGADAEDRYWKWGMIYRNPNDPHGIVTTRMGCGTTVNMAKSWAKVLTAAGLACLLLVPVLCIWMIAEEFTPIYLTYEDGVIISGQLRENYRIPEETVEEVQLLNEIPSMSKKNGTGMKNLRKGTFHIRNVGDCEVLQNPQNEYVLYIRTADGEYYLSDDKDAQTQKVYRELKDKE